MGFLWFSVILLPIHGLCDMTTFGIVGGDVQTNAHLLTSNSKSGIPNTFKCANECIGLGCVAFRYWKEETTCITYFIQGTGQASSDLVTKYFAKSYTWTISVCVSTLHFAGSSDTLYVDIDGTLSSVSHINLGNNLKLGEIRQHLYIGNFGEINHIRIYHKGTDGLRILKVTLDNGDGHLYTFLCNCWIDTDETGPGIQPSWLLYPQTK